VADRPRRPRRGRQAEPPIEPRRKPRTSSSQRRATPPAADRRTGNERPERRRRFDEGEPPVAHGTNGNGTHHPISRVRYRGEDNGEEPSDYRPRRRTTRDRELETWQYDI
jgi:hypothetical protein